MTAGIFYIQIYFNQRIFFQFLNNKICLKKNMSDLSNLRNNNKPTGLKKSGHKANAVEKAQSLQLNHSQTCQSI